MKNILLTSCLLLGACASTGSNLGSTITLTLLDFQQWSIQYPEADVSEYAPRAKELLIPDLDMTILEWTQGVIPSRGSEILAGTIVAKNPSLSDKLYLIASIIEKLNNV